jgi:hypothetical protein
MSSSVVNSVRGALFANVKSSDGSLSSERGFAGSVKNGNGDYTLEMQQGLNLQGDGGGLALCQAYGKTPALTAVEQVDDTHLRVRLTDNTGAALDTGCSLYIQPVGPS